MGEKNNKYPNLKKTPQKMKKHLGLFKKDGVVNQDVCVANLGVGVALHATVLLLTEHLQRERRHIVPGYLRRPHEF